MSRVAGRAPDASPAPLPAMVTPPSGLTDKEVSRRIAAGPPNRGSSMTVWSSSKRRLVY
jgi:hypothetical protein